MKTLIKDGYDALDQYDEELQNDLKAGLERSQNTRALLELLTLDYEFPDTTQFRSSFGGLIIEVPRDQAEINRLKAYMEAATKDTLSWYEEDHSKDDGSYNFVLLGKPQSFWSRIKIAFLAQMEGASCAIIKVGEETHSWNKPIYEVVCKEGAKEKAL